MENEAQTIEPAEAITRLITLTASSRDEAEQALIAARGNLDLAAQFLLEGLPQVGHVVAPETRRVAAGPGHLTVIPAEPPTPHRLIAKASALPGGSEALQALVDAVRSGTLVRVQPPDGRLEHPLLDELARTQLPLMRLVCEQLRSFTMLLSEHWRTQARQQAQELLTAKREAVQGARARLLRWHAAVTAATIEAAVAGTGVGAEVARYNAERATASYRRLQAALERAEASVERAALDLRVAVEAEAAFLGTPPPSNPAQSKTP
jgi:hypothetical protein